MKLTNYTQMEKNMWIKELRINNFRNYKNEEIKFEKNINIFYGENAQGKTNIIEAIFLCSMGRSFRTNKDKEMILLNESQANIEIEFEKSDFARFVSTKSLSVIVESINFVFCKSSPLKEHKFIKQFLKS